MVTRRLLRVAVVAAVLPALLAARQSSAIDKAFADFWKADDARGAEKAAEGLLKAGVDFDAAWARLKAGRQYGRERTGEQSMRSTAGAGLLIDT